jgi:hypothetical protein
MKTTMILPDHLMQKAKAHARKRGTNMTRLVEDALRAYLSAPEPAKKQLWHIDAKGEGGFTAPDLSGNWSSLREILYDK